MSDNIEATPRTRFHTLQEIDLKGQVADEGYELFEEGAEAHPALTPESSAAVRFKVDLHLLPLMCILYGLNYVDKVAMGWAVLFNFRDDLNLVGDQYSWASTEGVPHVMHTSTGSSAGTPLADLMYVIAMSKVMYKLRDSLQEEGLTSHIEIDGQKHSLNEVGYVDDSAIPVFAEASELVDKTSNVAQIVYSVFFQYSMQLNF